MQQKLEEALARGRGRGEELVGSAAARRWRDLARGLAQVIGWPTATLVERVIAFDAERLDAVPDLTVYPELRGYRDRLLAEDRGMREAGVDDALLALARSLSFYCQTRLLEQTGKAYYAEALPEKCRVLYVPESDEGVIHAKNIDDPAIYFSPLPPVPNGSPWPFSHPLVFDGVGSGLHIDEIPPEIFPVEVRELCQEHCTTLDAATEFMVRYNYFWHSQNLLVHDHHGNSVAFEKTRCRAATRGPNEKGLNFVTGMGALDPEIRAHQQRMRQKYLDQNGADWDGPDGCFWKVSQGKWDNMTRYVQELSQNPTLAGVMALMEKRDPSGPMCLTGTKCHPGLAVAGWTLIMNVYLMAQKKQIRRQYRDGTPAYLDPPEVVQYA